MNSTVTSNSITGRDGYIEMQALIYAVAYIQTLPEDRQEWSNMRDMCAIARTIDSRTLGEMIYGVQRHTGTVIDIWPVDDEYLSAHDRREKKAFKFAINSYIEMRIKQFADFVAAHPLRNGEAA